MESIAFKPFKCPLNHPNMGEIIYFKYLMVYKLGMLSIFYYVSDHRLPLSQILYQKFQIPNVHCTVSLTFLKRLGPVSKICLPSLIGRLL